MEGCFALLFFFIHENWTIEGSINFQFKRECEKLKKKLESIQKFSLNLLLSLVQIILSLLASARHGRLI
jgi:hypothetical protein